MKTLRLNAFIKVTDEEDNNVTALEAEVTAPQTAVVNVSKELLEKLAFGFQIAFSQRLLDIQKEEEATATALKKLEKSA